MAKKNNVSLSQGMLVDNIIVRMYRLGTGDFFLLKLNHGNNLCFTIMIDCGCIQGKKVEFESQLKKMIKDIGPIINLLIVTHEHADHINGFQLAKDIFNDITFEQVWFAWTEGYTAEAIEFRKNYVKAKKAIRQAALKMKAAIQKKGLSFDGAYYSKLLMDGMNHFSESLSELSQLSLSDSDTGKVNDKTMVDLLKECNVIKKDTKWECLKAGQVIENLENAFGIRFFILGPPDTWQWMKKEVISKAGYEKREAPSTVNLAFVDAVNQELEYNILPFESKYSCTNKTLAKQSYFSSENQWRRIDHDWLLGAGALAVKTESALNNTSLVVAIQFMESEKVLLFPADAEHGNWMNFVQNLKWKFVKEDREVDASYLLKNTVFYKVGHHLSYNGTLKQKGLEMMTHPEFSAMIPLDMDRLLTCWRNTMPNDYLGAELIRRAKGKVLFLGDRKKILKNILTHRVTVSQKDLDTVEILNQPFDGKKYIEYTVNG